METETTLSKSFEELQIAFQKKENQFEIVNESNLKLSECNKSLEEQVLMLQRALDEKQEEFIALEEDRKFLRGNIKKASAHWFERKAKLSESELDGSPDLLSRQNSGGSDSKKEPTLISISYEDAAVQVNLKPDVNDLSTNKEIKHEDVAVLVAELAYKTEQLHFSERKCKELYKRVKDFEQLINDQEIIIHGMNGQLETYYDDNQGMSQQLNDLNKLFQELEAIDKTNVDLVNPPDPGTAVGSALPTEKEFEDMAGSVSKTYVKLKDLIYEKKSLVTEIERLQTLNIELQRRVVQQESRLFSVSDAIHKTWVLVSDLKEQHAKIHTAESILRYELKEKREILHKLREELESGREQWLLIREKNTESELEWKSIHDELIERRRISAERKDGKETFDDVMNSVAVASSAPKEFVFEPPVDLLMDMGIEYGCIDPDDETSTTVIAAVEGEDIHEDRLQDLEDQCGYLYQKLMSSTARSFALASRLSSLHQHYSNLSDDEDEDEEDEDDDDDNENLYNDDTDANYFESEMAASPDSDSYDTAYVSEPDVADTPTGAGVGSGLSEDSSPSDAPPPLSEIVQETDDLDDLPIQEEDSCDYLSRRLINFLPKKIEILRAENKKLEEKCSSILDEKNKVEANLTISLNSERLLRRQLEETLKHLGKCVDELKLERNGKIEEAEKELKKKVERLDQQEKCAEELQEDLDALQEKFEERGNLLSIINDQLNKKEEHIKNLTETLDKKDEQLMVFANSSKIENPSMNVCENCQTNLQSSRLTIHSCNDHRYAYVVRSLHKLLRRVEEGEENINFSSEVEDLLSNIVSDDMTSETNPASFRHKPRRRKDSIEELEDDDAWENNLKEEDKFLESKTTRILTMCSSTYLKNKEQELNVWLSPCETVVLPVLLESGDTLCWSIQAYPKIAWLTLLQHPQMPCVSIDCENARLVMTRTKLRTDSSPVHGTLCAKLPGVYTFLFDNRTSRYTSRRVICKFWQKEIDEDKIAKTVDAPVCLTPNLEHELSQSCQEEESARAGSSREPSTRPKQKTTKS